VKDLQDKIADLEAMKMEIPENVESSVEDSMRTMAQTMRNILATRDHVASTALIQSIRWNKISNGAYVLRAGGKSRRAGHAPFVEFGTGVYNRGTRPEFSFESPDGVPLGEIRLWLIQKGQDPDDSTVWAIKKHIDKYGTRAHPFFRPAIHVHTREVSDNAEDALEYTVDKYN